MYDFDFETKTLISKECQDTDDVNTLQAERYIKIWDFMLFDLQLSNSELIIYAQIFAMFKNRAGAPFKGSKEYMAKWSNTSVRTVSEVLKSLEERGYIVKIQGEVNNKKRPMYCIDYEKLPTCRAFSSENYFADEIKDIRNAYLAKGIEFDKRKFYEELNRKPTPEEHAEFARRFVKNREPLKKKAAMIKEYYKTRTQNSLSE